MEGHKSKKPTKKQAVEIFGKNIADHTDGILKGNFILNLIQGSDIAYHTIVDYINDGHTLEEVKNFCQMNIDNRKVMEEVATKKEKDEKGEN